MSYKIIIDAGHGGSDPGAVYQGRSEKDDALRLALAVGRLLENAGVDVEYTRTSDVYDTPYEKAVKGNNSGADFFLSIHRNASDIAGSNTGVETLVYDKSGIKLKVAENINRNLQALGFANRGVIARPNLVVLKRSRMPAVMVEAGFIDNPADNELFDEKFELIAAAIADAVLDTLEIQNTAGTMVYRVQVAAFDSAASAQKLANVLTAKGFNAYVNHTGGYYKVQVGAYDSLEEAVLLENRLRAEGYVTYITT